MSRISAPCAAISRACAMATAGSKNWPPSENESGVTFRMPMTSGRPSRNRRASAFGVVSVVAVARAMRVALRWAHRPVKERGPASVADLQWQLLGAVDPARHHAFGRQQPHQFAALVGFGHGLGEIGRVAHLQLFHCVYAGCGQELGIFGADALHPHAVGEVRPAQELARTESGLLREKLALPSGARLLEQRAGRPYAGLAQHGQDLRINVRYGRERIRHSTPEFLRDTRTIR